MSMKSFLRSLGVEIMPTRNEIYERHPEAKELLDQFVMAQAQLVRHTCQYNRQQADPSTLELLLNGNDKLRKAQQAWHACRLAGVPEGELNILVQHLGRNPH